VAAAILVVAVVVVATRPASDATAGSEVETLFAGIPQEGLTLGDPDAPYTLSEYVDLQCPFCRDYTLQTLPSVIQEFVRDGQVKLSLRPIDILGPDSETASLATIAASEQNLAWQFADTFYRDQGPEGSGYVTDEFIRQVATQTPGLDVAALDPDSPSVRKVLDDTRRLAGEIGISSTPSFLLSKAGEQGQLLTADSGDPAAFTAQLREALGE